MNDKTAVIKKLLCITPIEMLPFLWQRPHPKMAKRSYTLEQEHAGDYYVQDQMQYSVLKANGQVEHNSLLDIDSEPHTLRSSGIICTIGIFSCFSLIKRAIFLHVHEFWGWDFIMCLKW